MITIGITGIIGSGKTTVSGVLQRKGYTVIDLDVLAKGVNETEAVKEDIRRTFGQEFIKEDNTINVERMRDLVFNDTSQLKILEGIIHPRVIAEMERQVALRRTAGDKAIIIDGPLIFETDLHTRLDKIVVVSADVEIIKKRLLGRGMETEDIEKRMAHQIPLKEKEKAAQYVVYNNGTEDDLKKEIDILLEKIKIWEVSDTCTLTT
jgi:dephospho-CoA kinase